MKWWEFVRKYENLHIVLWLIKDTCWLLDLKLLGTLIMIPTVILAVFIAVITRKNPKELAYNLAVSSWIVANSIWMLGEFYWDDQNRPIALIFFILGFVFIGAFHLRNLRLPKPPSEPI